MFHQLLNEELSRFILDAEKYSYYYYLMTMSNGAVVNISVTVGEVKFLPGKLIAKPCRPTSVSSHLQSWNHS